MDANSLLTGAEHLTRPAEEYVNDETVESMWVLKACQYADIHFKIITSTDPTQLKLTRHDDRIYTAFKAQFSDFNLEVTTEESLKSPAAKEKWRIFCDDLKDVDDYNYGTLVRLKCQEDYNEENTILVTRVQFLALEISRNREGFNTHIWTKHATAKSEKNS